MSDRLADTIAAKFRNVVGPKIANAFHADRYELIGLSRVRDAYGEWVETWNPTGESGYCALNVVNQVSGRRVENGIALTETSYEVEILSPSAITTKHRIRINGRTFDVTDVRRGGEMEPFVIAAIEEPEAR